MYRRFCHSTHDIPADEPKNHFGKYNVYIQYHKPEQFVSTFTMKIMSLSTTFELFGGNVETAALLGFSVVLLGL